MCTRYGLSDPTKLRDRYNLLSFLLNSTPKFNISPGHETPVIVKKLGSQYNQAEKMIWGMLPSWSKDLKLSSMMINARVETLDRKPSYQKPLKHQRCLIPASFYFEWKNGELNTDPYLIKLKYNDMFSMAGVYDVNEKAGEKPIKSFTIITCESNEIIKPIYHRMPVIFKKSDENIWLDPNLTDIDRLIQMLKPYPQELTEIYQVNSLVNDPTDNREEIIRPKL